ncbi:MAG: YifB family Mg chelatase-like AAA ATPase [Alphaproteobacteria bacterium]|nr:YifB family Mg chelatase-like AAA ATPase [Alphaproteobacteria bacterium]MBE8220105.1 YifB family Mg chelatase-like AAA ATPase [Alphaproteobacteria bacterium]
MVAHIKTIAFIGIDAVPVDVQVHLAPGQNAFQVVGLPDKSVAESRERVRAALGAVGLGLPYERITINLSPADLPKEGSHYDLPIALGLIVAMGGLEQTTLDEFIVMGELSLDGACTGVPGALPAAMAARARDLGLICPAACGTEAAWSGLSHPSAGGIVAATNLLAIINHMRGTQLLPSPEVSPETLEESGVDYPDMADIRGQHQARLALEVAAAGGHNMLMCGPPGAGKSMLAARLPGLLPPLAAEERLEISIIESLSSTRGGVRLAQARPFRSPHHSASMAALIGGGRQAKPGEVSLAHRGVLFLDELPEFSRQALDALRQPIETGEVQVARAEAHVSYLARFQLVAAMNPCRCGHADDPELACHRLPLCRQDYLGRISGPLLDRFDIRLDVPPVALATMIDDERGESSAAIAPRVAAARQMQLTRQNVLNAQLDGDDLRKFCQPDTAAQKLLDKIIDDNRVTARGFNRILRVARTLADCGSRETIGASDIASAIIWRGLTFNG